MKYEIEVRGEEAEFEPIEASDIHDACRKVRVMLGNRNAWGTGKAFMTQVQVRATDGSATVQMPVECACD